ncbi:hypothetical protein [Kitasatospora sp. NBC_01300]|nr:hypothetical protein OG556_25470 [Kitasatospora sp. NBC_01300]
MTSTPRETTLSPHATGPRLLARLTPLRQAGWTEGELWDETASCGAGEA